MKEVLADGIAKKLSVEFKQLRDQYHTKRNLIKTKTFVLDGLLPDSYVNEIYQGFTQSSDKFRRLDSFRERKSTSKNFLAHSEILKEVSLAFQDPMVVKVIESITNISNLLGDSLFYAGGLSAMFHGDYLHPHIDNSHDSNRDVYRRINLLYYVSSDDWKLEDGGNLEIWDDKLNNPKTILSKSNRLVLMETNKSSYHSVSKLKGSGHRYCVSNYLFSKQHPEQYNEEYFHVTEFYARPEFGYMAKKRYFIDRQLRKVVRKFVPSGIGKKDLNIEAKLAKSVKEA